jgi:hypothetical protein
MPGSRLARLPKAEATELAPEAVGAGPLTAIKTRVVSTGRLGGPSWTTCAAGETPERRLWAYQAKTGGLGPEHNMGFHSPMAFHSGGLGRSKKPSIQELLPPALWSLRMGLRTAAGWGATTRVPHSPMFK